MQVFQTLGEPPRNGKIILATNGWIQKSRKALNNNVKLKKAVCMLGRLFKIFLIIG
jgi:hypothetical protein